MKDMKTGWRRGFREAEPYIPGEQPKKQNIIKLNTNENPYPPSPGAAEAMKNLDFDLLRRYPDPEAGLLVSKLAQTYKTGIKNIFAGVGSDDVLAMAFLAFFNTGDKILFPEISYSFYEVWAKLFKIDYEKIPLKSSMEIDPEDYIRANGGIVIANPNAPTGLLLGLNEIEKILRTNRESVVIIDEAYIDFGGESALKLVDKYENLLVVQTFSKSRSMAGVRIGFAIGSEELIAQLNAVKYSFNSYTMNLPSILLGAAALDDDEYFKSSISKIIATRERTKAELSRLGFEFPDSAANFIFASHRSIPAEMIYEKLREKNIFVRYFKKPGIDNYLRITVGNDEEMNSFLKELENICRN